MVGDSGEVDLVGTPVVGKIGGCDWGRVWYVAGVQDQYFPDANFSSDLMHRLLIYNIGGEYQAVDAAADGL